MHKPFRASLFVNAGIVFSLAASSAAAQVQDNAANLKMEYQPGIGPSFHDGYQEFSLEDLRIDNKKLVWPLEVQSEMLLPNSVRNAIGVQITAAVVDSEGKNHKITIIAHERQFVCDIDGLAPNAPYVLKIKLRNKNPLRRLQSFSKAPFQAPVIRTVFGNPELNSDVAYDAKSDRAIFVEPRTVAMVTPGESDESVWLEWRGTSLSKGEANANVLNIVYRSITQQYTIPPKTTKPAPGPAAPAAWKLTDVGGLNSETLAKEVAAIGAALAPFGLKYCIVGDGWQSASPEGGPARRWVADEKRFPGGLKDVAARIRSASLIPGIWWIPESADEPAETEGILKHASGLAFQDALIGSRIWDPSQAAGRAKIVNNAVEIVKNGFEYLYCEGQPEFMGLYKTAEQETPMAITCGTDFRATVDELRAKAGAKVMLAYGWGGGGPKGAPFTHPDGLGLFDIIATGPSTKSGIDIFKNAAVPAAPGSRMNGNIAWIDPGPVHLGEDLTLDAARAWASLAALSGQAIVFEDRIDTLKPERLDIAKRVLPTLPIYNSYAPSELPGVRAVTLWREMGGETSVVAAYFAWDAKQVQIPGWFFDEFTQKNFNDCEKFEFWSNRFLGRAEYTKAPSFSMPEGSCAVIAARKPRNYPFVISTNRHVSQGALDLRQEKYDSASMTLSAASDVVAGDLYELRIVLPDESWSAGALNAAGVSGAVTREGRLVRASWTPAATGTVLWNIKFTKKDGATAESQPETAQSRPAAGEITKLSGRTTSGPVVHVQWAPDRISSGVFVILRDGEPVASTLANEFHDADSRLIYGKEYRYEVVHLDENNKVGATANFTIKTKQPARVPLKDLGWTSRRVASPLIFENQSVKGTPISLASKSYKTGIGTAPPTILDIPLKGATGFFTAIVGIDDCAEGKGSAIIKFSVDGKEIGRSGVLKGGAKPRNMKLRVTRGEILTIAIEDNADGWDFDYISIAEPEIRLAGPKK